MRGAAEVFFRASGITPTMTDWKLVAIFLMVGALWLIGLYAVFTQPEFIACMGIVHEVIAEEKPR